jgi:hypothetical protein
MRERERREETGNVAKASRSRRGARTADSVERLEREPNPASGPSKLPRQKMAGGARSWF